jgi:phosphate transport system substrate-binding protein
MLAKMFSTIMTAATVAATVAATGAATAQTTLTGAGATFPYPMYSKWFDDYHKLHPEIQINYQSIGSGGGIRQVSEGTVDFGATDGPMTEEQLKDFRAKRNCDVLHFPTVLGANVPCYNIPGVNETIVFTPDVLADIFLGKITKWNDKRIAAVNSQLTLPNHEIVVVHRSDGSGTTYIWVDYLSKVSAEWKNKVGVGTSVKWPVGLGGKGNEGVAGLIKHTPGAIGYVELIYAVQNKLAYGSVQNAAGKVIKADLKSVTAAAASVANAMPADFRVSITNAPGENAYPIASFTWLLVPTEFKDQTKKKVIVDFLHWMLTEGQKSAETLGYAPLPKEVVDMALKAIAKIK